jgi:hypothetical protein
MGIESGGEQPQDFLPEDYDWTQAMVDANEGAEALIIDGPVSADAAEAISDRICQTNPATEGVDDAQDGGVSYSVNLGANRRFTLLYQAMRPQSASAATTLSTYSRLSFYAVPS